MRTLFTLSLFTMLAGAVGAQQADSLFEEPVRLTVDGQPINTNPKLLYPSPILVDIDNDAQTELVVGDLWGNLYVHESTGKAGGVAWEPAKKLQTADGNELKLPNW